MAKRNFIKRERMILTALHLGAGDLHKTMIGMNLEERRAILNSMLKKGYITQKGEVTPKGIKIAAPNY